LDAIARRISDRYEIPFQTAKNDGASVYKALAQKQMLPPVGSKDRRPVRIPRLDSLYLHITNRCNLSCLQCYAGAGQRKKDLDLPTARILALIDELVDQGGNSITISGGEPFLHPDIEQIMAYAGRKLSIRLLSNGTRIDEKRAQWLADLDVFIQLSIDGPNSEINDAIRGKGTFKRILRAIDLLHAAGLSERLNLCTTVMNQNISHLHEIIRLADRLGVPLVRFLPLRDCGAAHGNWGDIASGITVQDHEAFYHEIQKLMTRVEKPAISVSCGLSGFMLEVPEPFDDGIWCPVGRQLVVNTDGHVYPCVLLMQEAYGIGNIFHDDLDAMIQSSEMAGMCEMLVSRRHQIEKCASCQWQNLCQAGCMGQALDNRGTIWDVDDFCTYRYAAYGKAFQKLLKPAKTG
jgi:radical SAM protein with 4Fe4S-binding SPASM domain